MAQPARAVNRTFFSLPLHHLLFPHLFLQPPHLSPAPSLIPHSSSPTTPPNTPPPSALLALHHSTCIQHRSQGAQASFGLYIHAVRTLCCCTTLRSFFSHTATTEPQLHEQGQLRQSHPPYPYSPPLPPSILSICLPLPL